VCFRQAIEITYNLSKAVSQSQKPADFCNINAAAMLLHLLQRSLFLRCPVKPLDESRETPIALPSQ
jgi:hypothetical protein